MFMVQLVCQKKLGQRKEIFTLIVCGVHFVHKIIEEKSDCKRKSERDFISTQDGRSWFRIIISLKQYEVKSPNE